MIYFFHRRRFVQCFINKVLHFDITITSRTENEHAILKRQLNSFNENLKTVVNDINLLLTNKLDDHFIVINEVKNRFSIKFRKSIFQQLIVYVFFYALRKIAEQYFLLMDKSTAIRFCIHAFIIIMRFSCSHKIQKRMYEIANVILLKDVHSH